MEQTNLEMFIDCFDKANVDYISRTDNVNNTQLVAHFCSGWETEVVFTFDVAGNIIKVVHNDSW